MAITLCLISQIFSSSFALATDPKPAASATSLKAVYTFNFLRFTEWPEPRMNDIQLSVLGNLPLLKKLKSLADSEKGQKLGLHPTVCDTPACLQQSNAVFIDANHPVPLWKILVRVKDRPILTISDIPGFAEKGGMIELHRDKERMKLRINLKKVWRANIYVSAQVLQLAEIVETENE